MSRYALKVWYFGSLAVAFAVLCVAYIIAENALVAAVMACAAMGNLIAFAIVATIGRAS